MSAFISPEAREWVPTVFKNALNEGTPGFYGISPAISLLKLGANSLVCRGGGCNCGGRDYAGWITPAFARIFTTKNSPVASISPYLPAFHPVFFSLTLVYRIISPFPPGMLLSHTWVGPLPSAQLNTSPECRTVLQETRLMQLTRDMCNFAKVPPRPTRCNPRLNTYSWVGE